MDSSASGRSFPGVAFIRAFLVEICVSRNHSCQGLKRQLAFCKGTQLEHLKRCLRSYQLGPGPYQRPYHFFWRWSLVSRGKSMANPFFQAQKDSLSFHNVRKYYRLINGCYRSSSFLIVALDPLSMASGTHPRSRSAVVVTSTRRAVSRLLI